MSHKKNPLITSDRVYYMLKWHQKADPKKAFIKFINYGQLKTVSYHDWIPMEKGGEIPWHRVHLIQYAGEVLWDRDRRLYHPEILEVCSYFSNISLLRFTGKVWKQVDQQQAEPIKEHLSIITLNCLIDKYDKHLTDLKPRMPVILKYLQEYSADVVCLQEITLKFKEQLLECPFIREHYYVTNNEPKIFGQLILSKYQPACQNLVTLDGNHMKKYLQMGFLNKFEELVEIINLHLTSDKQTNSDYKRQEQLTQLFSEIQADKVIVVGDFNHDDNFHEMSGFRDVWKELCPGQEGFTFDYLENGLTSKTTKSFLRSRIDKILYKNIQPLRIQLAFNESVKDIWASDHFGLLSKINVNQIQPVSEVPDSQKIQIKPGTILCLVLEPVYWKYLNTIRSKYDDGYSKIAPHVTLFQKFVSPEEFPQIRDQIHPRQQKVVFDQVEIFELTQKLAVVLTTSEESSIIDLRANLEKCLNMKIDSRPHITLAIVDSSQTALRLKKEIGSCILKRHSIEVSLSSISFLHKCGPQYRVFDHIGSLRKTSVKDLIIDLVENFCFIYQIELVGSRAYGIEDSDYDYILIGNLTIPSFSQQCVCLSKMSPYFKYVKFIDGRIPTLNLITQDGDEINLIYQKKYDISIGVQNSIDSVKIIKKMVSEQYQLFVDCYQLVRVWAKRRHIYGSKYGYLNGITWMILTLNAFRKLDFDHKKMFIRKFFKYYANFDWKEPINIMKFSAKKETQCDQMIFIRNVRPGDYLVRTLSPSTWKVIKEEFARTQDLKDLNLIFENKKIVSPLVKITIEEPNQFNVYEKQYQIMSEFWRIPLSTPGVIPGIDWEKSNNQLSYKFKVSPDSDSQIIYSYFRKFQCLVEFL